MALDLPPKFCVPKLYLADTCRWWLAGDQSQPAQAAIALRDSDSVGNVGLDIFPLRNSQFENLDGVRHRNDPWLLKRPETLRDNGCWDFRENDPRCSQSAAVHQPEAKPAGPPIGMDVEAQEDFIVTQRAKGKTVRTISLEVTKLAGVSWSEEKVRDILKRKSIPGANEGE